MGIAWAKVKGLPSKLGRELSHTTAEPSVVTLRACEVSGMKQDLVKGATALLKSLEEKDQHYIHSKVPLCPKTRVVHTFSDAVAEQHFNFNSLGSFLQIQVDYIKVPPLCVQYVCVCVCVCAQSMHAYP